MLEIKTKRVKEGRTMNALNQPNKAATLLFVFALSLSTAAATTTNVIFSCEEDEGEYADTDLETDNAGNIYGTTVLGGLGAHRALQLHRWRRWR
jgi:hypothetical protein